MAQNKLKLADTNTNTGTGAFVFATSPTLVTPTLGVAAYTSLSGGNITDSALTSGRVVFASTGGLLVDDADFTFATDTLTVTKIAATSFTGAVTLSDVNLILGTTTGTKFGTATSQKLSFYNSTPIVQPSGNIITALTNLGLVATPTLPASSVSSGAALTKVDDTNVTLTLGGTPATSLLVAASLTLGWTGTLAVARGGTGGGAAGITLFNNITGYTAAGATGTTSTNLVFSTSPTLVTPVLGVATATSLNGLTISTSTGTLTITNGKTLAISNSITFSGTDGVSMNVSNNKIRTQGFTVDGGGSAISTGKVKGYFTCPFAGTITGYNIMADTGTVTVKVWKIATGTAVPTSGNSINTSGVALATGTAIHSNTVTDFTSTTVTANDIFAYNIEAVSGVTQMTFELEITAT